MKDKKLSEITYVRLSPEQKVALERIADGSMTQRLSDHIRFAIEQYIAAEEAKAGAEPSLARA